jgi:hypothetical protein
MARVLALIPDLLFGSRVQASLVAARHEVELIHGESRLRERLDQLRQSTARGADAASVPARMRVALVVDLTDEQLDGAGIVGGLREREGGLSAVRTLGFYSHVDAPARERALQAGFDMVVPRSRMAREAPALVQTLLS